MNIKSLPIEQLRPDDGTRATYSLKEIQEDGWNMLPESRIPRPDEPLSIPRGGRATDVVATDWYEHVACAGKGKLKKLPHETLSAEETEWIPHDGGGCPVPWAAAAGEFEQEFDNGYGLKRTTQTKATYTAWCFVKRWRLTDGWIPVLNGKMPKEIEGAKHSEFEIRFDSGAVEPAFLDARNYNFDSGIFQIVAVRLVKRHVTHEEQKRLDEVTGDVRESVVVGCLACNGPCLGHGEPFRNDSNQPRQKLTKAQWVAQAKDKKREQQRQRSSEAYERYKARFPKPNPAPRSIGDIEGLILAAMMEGER